MSPARGTQPSALDRICAAIVGTLLLALLISPAAASATELPTTISENMTLTAEGSPYTGSSVTISEGVTVVAEPGAIVKLTGSLTVRGTLDVNGTAEESVIVTSSGDSAPGQWTGIQLEAGAGSSSLSHAEVRYAKTAIAVSGGISPEIVNSVVRDNSAAGISASGGSTQITGNALSDNGSGIVVSGNGSPEIADNTIEDCAGYGISQTIASKQTGEVRIHDNTIERCGSSGKASIYVSAAGTLTGVTLAGNTVADGDGHAIEYYTGGDDTVPPDIDENTLTGNASNALWVAGKLAESTTWEDRGFPIVLMGGFDFTVATGATLTLGPGLALKPSQENAVFRVLGELLAKGTEAEPITLTSIKDDSVGGDTNMDGAASKPAAGDFVGVSFTEGNTTRPPGRGTLSYVHARYGGYAGPCACTTGPMFYFGGPAAGGPTSLPSSIQSSTFEHSVRPAVSGGGGDLSQITDSIFASNGTAISIANAGDPQITGNALSDNGSGIVVSGNGSPEIAANTIEDCAGYGISQTIASKQTGEVRIHDNTIERCGNSTKASIYVYASDFNSVLTGITLAGNTITDGNGRAIDYYTSGDDTVPPDIDENTLTGNASNALWVAGKLAESTTWESRGFPIVPMGGFDFTVATGATLTLGPGLVLKPNQENAVFQVRGELIAKGTAAEPITLTSIKDDSVGGDTNMDGAATKPEPGDYIGVHFIEGNSETPPGRGDLDYVRGRFGGYGGPCACSTGPMIRFGSSAPEGPTSAQSTVRRSLFNFSTRPAIYVAGDFPNQEAPEISWNRFAGNGTAIDKAGKNMLTAPYNDYGCLSGPRPQGCGDPIGPKVNPSPLQSEADEKGRCRGKKTDCPKGADPVSLASGELTYSHRDLLLTNKSDMPLEFVRSYSSGDSSDSGLGPAWSHTALATATELENGDVLVRRQDGRQDVFTKEEGGAYARPAGVTDTLVKNEDGTFSLTTLDRAVYDFEASGRIATITNDHGLKTTYGYDANGRLATITDPSAQTLSFGYDASNHITSVKDSTEREVKYTYSAAGDLKTVTDALGGVTEYSYDSEHRITSITDPKENVILQNTYDSQGRVIEQLDGLENLWKLEYKEGETIVTEPQGGKKTYAFDELGRVVAETDQLGNKTTTAYDAAGNVAEVVRPGTAKWTFGYDAAGNLTSVTDPLEGKRSYSYDAQNRPTSLTDARGKTWSYEWSEANDLVKVTDPAEGETKATYDAAGQPLSVTDPKGHTTTFSYDSRGNRLTAKDPLEHTTSFAYDARNYLTSRTEPGLEPEELARNALGELLSRTTPLGNTTKYAYDANGMPTQITDPAEGVWKIAYNAMERPVTYTDPLEGQISVAYDGNLNPTKVTDRRGKETSYGYDQANRLIAIEAPEAGDWSFGYDSRGNRTSAIDPRESTTTYEYDLLDRMTKVGEPLETTTSYAYDAAGNLTSFTDPRENTTGLLYDDLGRLTAINQPLEKTTSFSYDGAGNLLSRTTAAGTLEYSYDAADRLQKASAGEATLRSLAYDEADRLTGALDAQGDEIEIGYDEDGRIVSLADGRGQSVSRKYDSRGNLIEQTDGRGTLSYGYDKLNRMTSLTDPQEEALSFAYDAEGNLTEAEPPNGAVTTNSYDNADRLSATTTTKGEAVLQSFEYGYDPAGNRISQVDRLSQETTYSYDALGRLTEFDPPDLLGELLPEPPIKYGYDPAGNRTSAGETTFSYNALNQLTSSSDGTTYSYDGAGRLVEKGALLTTTYEWNALDELVGVDTGLQEVTYTYDALGRRAARAGASGTQGAHYGDLTDVPILDTDSEGKVATSYVQGPQGLAEQRSGEATSFPLPDAHGDVTALLDAEGGVASRQSYDPWGVQLSGPSLEMGYLGAQQRRSDPATGLIQMGVRPYSPALASFIAEDPVLGHFGIGTSLNRYAYVWDNPLNLYDLDGRAPFGLGAPGLLGDAWDATGGKAWDATAGARTAVGVAGDGNGGWLNESPGFISDRIQDFWKQYGNLVLGCAGGAGGAVALLNLYSGGTVWIPGLGWVTQGGAALAGCVIGATSVETIGANPIRTR